MAWWARGAARRELSRAGFDSGGQARCLMRTLRVGEVRVALAGMPAGGVATCRLDAIVALSKRAFFFRVIYVWRVCVCV